MVASFLYSGGDSRFEVLLQQRGKQKDTKWSLKLPQRAESGAVHCFRGQLCCVQFGPSAFTSQPCMNDALNAFDLLRASLIW